MVANLSRPKRLPRVCACSDLKSKLGLVARNINRFSECNLEWVLIEYRQEALFQKQKVIWVDFHCIIVPGIYIII